jgi:hypothetical protein
MEFLIPIVLFICVAAVLVLRPLSKNVGRLLEQMARERRQSSLGESDAAALRLAIENLGKRLELMEDRLDFTERLIEGVRRNSALPGAGVATSAGYDERARVVR